MAVFEQAYAVVQQTIVDLENADNLEQMDFDGLVMRLDYLCRSLVNNDDNSRSTTDLDSIIRMIEEAMWLLRNCTFNENPMDVASKHYTGSRGRPSFNISESQLSFLIEHGFQVPVIAKLLGVSTRTIERRMATYSNAAYW